VFVTLWHTVKGKKIDFEYLERDFPDEELPTGASSQPHILQEDCLKATAVSALNHQRVDFNDVINQ
jgi:hypothetical protein